MTFLRRCGDAQFPTHLPDYVSCFVRKLRSRRKRWFWAPDFRGIPQISDMHFKSRSLPSMQPVLVEFCSASSEGRWRKERRRIAVKPKSADDYVGRPNYDPTLHIEKALSIALRQSVCLSLSLMQNTVHGVAITYSLATEILLQNGTENATNLRQKVSKCVKICTVLHGTIIIQEALLLQRNRATRYVS